MNPELSRRGTKQSLYQVGDRFISYAMTEIGEASRRLYSVGAASSLEMKTPPGGQDLPEVQGLFLEGPF